MGSMAGGCRGMSGGGSGVWAARPGSDGAAGRGRRLGIRLIEVRKGGKRGRQR